MAGVGVDNSFYEDETASLSIEPSCLKRTDSLRYYEKDSSETVSEVELKPVPTPLLRRTLSYAPGAPVKENGGSAEVVLDPLNLESSFAEADNSCARADGFSTPTKSGNRSLHPPDAPKKGRRDRDTLFQHQTSSNSPKRRQSFIGFPSILGEN
jgi:hypothetical protein